MVEADSEDLLQEADTKKVTSDQSHNFSFSSHSILIPEPLPMKLRALPQSFWQQPNLANPLSPGAVYSRLPPLPGQAAAEDTADLLAADHVPPLHEVAGEAAEHTLRCRDIESLISSQKN